MNQNDKQIHDWQEKVRTSFGDASRLYQYLFETMDNFYYRYIETTTDKNLKTSEISPGTWGAMSFEKDMVQALKVRHPQVKAVVMNYAKTVPKSEGPKVRYSLTARTVEFTAERGELLLSAEVRGVESYKKEVNFKYQDLAHFRKELALKLEEVCEIFL